MMPAFPDLAPPLQVASGYALPADRAAWATLFRLDQHLGSLTAQAREPLLAQVRLAWWRDALASAGAPHAAREPLLIDASEHLAGMGAALAGLASGWECLLGDAPLPPAAMREYLDLRSAAFANMAQQVGHPDAFGAARIAANWWVAGDSWSRLSDSEERAQIASLASAMPSPAKLPRALRSLAVLGALGERAIRLRQPVFDGRGAALLALRLGLFGR